MFIHLHNHSEYSLLNGAIRIQDLVAKAKEYKMPAVALTDYGNIFGAVEFYEAAKKSGIKPIMGTVVFLPSNDDHTVKVHRRGIDHLFHLVLLIENQTGYKNLCQLLTRSCLEGFYYRPRVDSKLLAEYSEGLIALSAGWDGAINQYLLEGQREKARESLRRYRDIFPGRFYVELQENGVEGQHNLSLELLEMARQEGVPVVATNNCHYLSKEDAEAFEALLCIQLGATLHGAGHHLKFSTDEYHFKTVAEMESAFQYAPEALAATSEIANRCRFEFELDQYYFPKFEPPAGFTLDQFLEEEAKKGLDERWPAIMEQWSRRALRRQKKGGEGETKGPSTEELRERYEKRLSIEFDMIRSMGFSGYFLIVSDFIRYAKGRGIPVGPGRGSAAGSLVAYCVNITDLDPIPYGLLFERFLNPERISMPDVDIDFCMRGRDEVLRYVEKRYGNVSQIITFGKMKARAVIRDVGRVTEMPLKDVDRIAKLVPTAINITLDEAIKQEPRLKKALDDEPQAARVIEIARRLEGLNRHASTHAAGVVISDRPLTDFLPLYKGSHDEIVTQFDMKSIEKIGLIKFDFLGLKTLTVLDDALKIIRRTQNETIDLLALPIDDPAVYGMLGKGDTGGVFQLESSGMRDLIVRLKPTTFEDLVALLALYRPGPLGSGMVDDFINRKQGRTQIVYDLPALKPILAETYGVIIYQEQVMRIASVLAGYSLGEADILRRAMGKKKASEMAAQRLRFLQGCLEKEIPRVKAEKIFDLMAKFAEYGFNKSHSAAYALISYQTAYLKAHYPVEYMASVLTNESGDVDRVLYYLQDCEAHGITVLPPDINDGFAGFSVVSEKSIGYGLGAVKNIGEGAVEAILEARKSLGGLFKSLSEFCQNVDLYRVNRRVLESLIKCGAFDRFNKNRAQLLGGLEKILQQAARKKGDAAIGQGSLFGGGDETIPESSGREGGEIPPWGEAEKLAQEKEALGFYLSGHPLKSWEASIRRVATSDTKLCATLTDRTPVTLAGLIVSVKTLTTKKGQLMAFGVFEDLRGNIEATFFSDIYSKFADLLSQDQPLVLKGDMDRSEDGAKIIVREVILLTDYLNQKTQSIHLRIPAPLFTADRVKNLNTLLEEYRGDCRGFLHVIHPGEAETVLELPKGIRVSESADLSSRINSLFECEVVEYRT